MSLKFPPLAFVLLSCVLPLVLPAASFDAGLVADIEPLTTGESSFPERFVAHGRFAFFETGGAFARHEIWATDGTAENTTRLPNVCRGFCFDHNWVGKALGRVFYRAVDSAGSTPVLFAVQGRAESTRLLLEGSLVDFTITETPSRQRAVLTARAFTGAPLELWSTDGTRPGTLRLLTFGPESRLSSPFVPFGPYLYFSVVERSPLRFEIWRTDGTAAGTSRWFNGSSGIQMSPAGTLAGKLLFTRFESRTGFQLWLSDGTVRGTRLAVDFLPGRRDELPHGGVLVGDRYYLILDSPRTGQELWVTNGTQRGTRQLTNFRAADAFDPAEAPVDFPILPVGIGGRFVFSVNDGVHGEEYWGTDGTAAGTRLLADICPGECSGVTFAPAIPEGERLWLTGTTTEFATEPWVTDGTPAGTRRVLEGGGMPVGRLANGMLLFSSGDDSRLSLSDGTAAGTQVLAEGLGQWTTSTAILQGGRSAVLGGFDPAHGVELWRTDGTPGGTGLLRDLLVGDRGGSFPKDFLRLGDRALFTARESAHGGEIWESDGTPDGTRLFGEIEPGPEPLDPPELIAAVQLGDKTLLSLVSRSPGESGLFLKTGDSTALERISARGFDDRSATLGAQLFYLGDGLWVTDGTANGTRQVEPNASGFVLATPSRVFFSLGFQLFATTSGTPETTVALLPANLSWTRPPVVHRGRLFFFVQDDENRAFLWSSDGTPGGTRQERELAGESSSSLGNSELLVLGERLLLATSYPFRLLVVDGAPGLPILDQGGLDFLARHAISDGRLFYSTILEGCPLAFGVSDGTAAGTSRFCVSRDPDVIGGPFVLAVEPLAEGVLIHGSGGGASPLFFSDGTEAGSVPIDLPLASETVSLGDRILFAGYDPAAGVELWSLTAVP